MPWKRDNDNKLFPWLFRQRLWNTSRNSLLEDVETIVKESTPTNTVNNTTLIDQSSYNTYNNKNTSYVNNSHSEYTDNSVKTTVINNFSFPAIKRQPEPFDRPPSILPTDIDNQTATRTSAGSSINVSDALDKYRNSFSRLIHNPLSLQREGIARSIPNTNFTAQINKDLSEAVTARETDPELIPGALSGYLIGGETLGGLKGNGTLFLGLKALSTYAQMNRALSSLAFIEPLNTIAVKYKTVDIRDDFKEFSIDDLQQYLKDAPPI